LRAASPGSDNIGSLHSRQRYPESAKIEPMNITFPHSEMHVRVGEPVMFLASADGRRIDVRIEWPVVEAVSGARDEDGVRRFVAANRSALESIIRAHLLARGVPLNHVLELGRNELAPLRTGEPAAGS
jgi:hypothetical protein